jgi:hypothetical protein
MGDLIKNNTIHLNNRDGHLLITERVYSQFAGKVRDMMMDLYFAGMDVPISLIGSQSQVQSFMQSMSHEKRYMDSFMKHGLNDSRTLDSRHDLMQAVKAFERETGLRWPFTN